MEKHICDVDILGRTVKVYLSDDTADKLKPSKKGKIVGGHYEIWSCGIWLNAACTPTLLPSILHHEVNEFLLGLLEASYEPVATHDFFTDFNAIVWYVQKTNQEVLYGTRLERLVSEALAEAGEPVAQ